MSVQKIEWNSLFVALSLLSSGLLIVGAGLLVDYSSSLWALSQAVSQADPAVHSATPASARVDTMRVPVKQLDLRSSADDQPKPPSMSVRVN